MKCAVISPIGPGHMDLYEGGCLPSIQTAISYSKGPFDEIVPMAMDDTDGLHGRSARRNEAIRQASNQGIEWVFFLDADDLLAPNAFEEFGKIISAEPDLDAVWGLIAEMDETGETHLRDGQIPQIDTRQDLLGTMPFLSIQMGHFLKTEIAQRFGFDETMDTGEDFKLYYQVWREYRCAKRPTIFFINRRGLHSTGPRSANGVEWGDVVYQQWQEQLADEPGRATIEYDGKTSYMAVTNPKDLIQAHHTQGKFFEENSLEQLKGILKTENPRILEVGANIGNHVVFYAKHLNASLIYPVEPNPAAISLLNVNIAMNGCCHKIDRRGIGFGVGNHSGRYKAVTGNQDNLGATSLVEDPNGDLEVVPLDVLMEDAPVDFMKIDAEGMELEVLDGAKELIKNNRPLIWIEILRENVMPFAQKWCRANGYRVFASTTYVNTIDYFVAPKERML